MPPLAAGCSLVFDADTCPILCDFREAWTGWNLGFVLQPARDLLRISRAGVRSIKLSFMVFSAALSLLPSRQRSETILWGISPKPQERTGIQ
jgi:hypothetical protein